MGDERLNPYIPQKGRYTSIYDVIGDTPQDDIDTKSLYEDASQKYNIYHINVIHNYYSDSGIRGSFSIIGQRYRESTIDKLADEIVAIIKDSVECSSSNVINNKVTNEKGEITW